MVDKKQRDEWRATQREYEKQGGPISVLPNESFYALLDTCDELEVFRNKAVDYCIPPDDAGEPITDEALLKAFDTEWDTQEEVSMGHLKQVDKLKKEVAQLKEEIVTRDETIFKLQDEVTQAIKWREHYQRTSELPSPVPQYYEDKIEDLEQQNSALSKMKEHADEARYEALETLRIKVTPILDKYERMAQIEKLEGELAVLTSTGVRQEKANAALVAAGDVLKNAIEFGNPDRTVDAIEAWVEVKGEQI